MIELHGEEREIALKSGNLMKLRILLKREKCGRLKSRLVAQGFLERGCRRLPIPQSELHANVQWALTQRHDLQHLQHRHPRCTLVVTRQGEPRP